MLYKTSRKTGKIPIDLKQAIITRIYKGGSGNLPKNYHPVALTSHLIKILEKILSKNIHFLEMHQKMNPKQHGFCSGRAECVAINGTTSSEAQVRSSVPQG